MTQKLSGLIENGGNGGNGWDIVNPALGDRLQALNAFDFTQGLLRSFISLGLVLGAIIFLFMLLWGGIQWMTSGGDKAQTENARNRITNAFTGLVILLSIFAIISLVEYFFDINMLLINISGLRVGN